MRRFHPLITGTLLLTAVGFFCRILGFFTAFFSPGSSVPKAWAYIR